jgi:lipopolysaccharide/colanic/teichoic acid biosynthesis glycosyltransferase
VIKRVFDATFAAIGLALLAPALMVLAIAVRLSSSGPVYYRGLRIGLNGKLFRIAKFRTMVANAEALGGLCTSSEDPRITPVGRWLRKYKLDELPQLFNVLKGDMSFVGPRPEAQEYTDLFNEEEKQILSVRPGITDWATFSNSDEEAILAGSPDPERTYLEDIRPEKIRLQLKYVRERNLWIDFKILLATVILVLRRCFGGGSPERSRRQHSLGRET